MNTDVKAFIELLNSQVNRGIYVWGGNGEDLTAMLDPIAWIERREEDPKMRNATLRFMGNAKRTA